jgi:precorrin-6Y C5,15-methyltransferase (decarboxylating) CbiT subunit
VRAVTARDFNLEGIAPLNTIALDLVAAPDAKILSRAPGLPDEFFENDGQITKAEFRALALSALAPRRGERLWDIGAGSGSIAIEFLLADEKNSAIAIEANALRAERIARNARSLGTPQLRIVQGRAPEALDGLPAPEKIFIGGGATTPGVIDAALAALKQGGRLVAHGVTLETQSLFVARHGALGGQLIEARIARAEKLGGFTALRPALPILQWIYDKHSLLAIGVGCATKASAADIAALVRKCLDEAPPFAGATIFSPARKADQPALREAADQLGLTLVALDDAEFLARQEEFCARGAKPSAPAHAATGLASVAEAAALMGGGPSAVLLRPRRAENHVTCALAAPAEELSR